MDHNILKKVVYTSERGNKHPGRLFLDMFSSLIKSRELAIRFFIRDVSGMYRQSILGISWAFVEPITHTIIWIFLNYSGSLFWSFLL